MAEFLNIFFIFFLELYSATILTNLYHITIFSIFEEVLIFLFWFHWFIKWACFLSFRFRLFSHLNRTFMNFLLCVFTFYLCLTNTRLRNTYFLDHLFTENLFIKFLVVVYWVSNMFYLVVFKLFYYVMDIITNLLINNK